MMKLSFLQWAAISLLVGCIYHVAESASPSDQQRLETLTAARKSSSHSLISLSISSLRPLIESAPRSYSLIVMFTADPALCKPCGAMRKQVQSLSGEYATLPTRRASNKPVFFAEVKLSQSDQEFLAAYGIRHVPILYHFGAGPSKSYPTTLSDSSSDSFALQKHGLAINAMKKFVNDRTGSALKVVRGGYEVPFVQTVRKLKPYIFTLLAIAAAIAIYTGAYKSPMLWFAIVVMVYIFSVGGGHYSWIHNTPLVVVDNNGRTQYVSGGNRSQYVAEGFFVSLTCVCISGLVILIQELPSFLPQKSAQGVVGFSMFFMTVCAIGALLTLYQSVSSSPHIVQIQQLTEHATRVLLPFLTHVFVHILPFIDVCRKCQGTCTITKCKKSDFLLPSISVTRPYFSVCHIASSLVSV